MLMMLACMTRRASQVWMLVVLLCAGAFGRRKQLDVNAFDGWRLTWVRQSHGTDAVSGLRKLQRI